LISFFFFGLKLQELIKFGVEGNEIVSLLQWVINTYPEILLELGIPYNEVGPILDESVVKGLQDRYLNVRDPRFLLL
jgi:hypothetical protein